jgi:hypothetical protein
VSSTRQTLGRTQPTAHRVVSEIRKRYAAAGGATPFSVRLFDGSETMVGQGEPRATLVICTQQGLDALSSFDVIRVGEAYLDGDLDAEGDLYLWGCVDGFARDVIQAYRLVLRNPR